MRNLLCDKTFAQINDLIERINVAINDNIREIDWQNATGQDVIFEFKTYDNTVYSVKGSNTRTYMIVKGNSEDVTPVNDRDRKVIIGDKGGIYFEKYPYAAMTDTRYFEATLGIQYEYITAISEYLNGYLLSMNNYHIEGEQYVDYYIYKVCGLEIGQEYTVTFYIHEGDMNAAGTDGAHLLVLKTADGGTGSTNRYCQINLATGASTDTGCSGTTTIYQIPDTGAYVYRNGSYTLKFTAEDDEAYFYFDFSAIVDDATDNAELEIEGLLFAGMELGVLSSKIYFGHMWYDYAGSGGGSSDVELIEISKADYDALPQSEKDDPNKAYFVYNYPSGSGGGGGGSGNTISYGTTTLPATANDGDLYFYLDSTTNEEKGKYLYMNNTWVLISGQSITDFELYNNGTESVEFGLYQATKEATYIEIDNGGGYLNYYTNTVNKIDVTDFEELYCKYQFNGAEYEQSVDISSYTGEKYIMFHYFSGYGFNNCAVSITDELYTSTTFPATDVIELTRSLVANTVKTKVRKIILR